MKDDVRVEECINQCPFYQVSMDGMECGHYEFRNKEPYANMIISQSDRGGFPEKCPLRKQSASITTNVSMKLSKDKTKWER